MSDDERGQGQMVRLLCSPGLFLPRLTNRNQKIQRWVVPSHPERSGKNNNPTPFMPHKPVLCDSGILVLAKPFSFALPSQLSLISLALFFVFFLDIINDYI